MIKFFPSLHSLMSLIDLRFMSDFVNPHGKIVNLGIWHGMSLLNFCKIYPGREVIGLDNFFGIWKGDDKDNIEYPPSPDRIRSNLKLYGYSPNIVKCDSLNPPVWIDDIGVLFVDTCHTGKFVTQEMSVWLPRLRKDALVFFHDYKQFYDYGYPQAIDEIFKDWNNIGSEDQMVCFSR